MQPTPSDTADASVQAVARQRSKRLARNYLVLLLGAIAFTLAMAWLEVQGLSRPVIAATFLLVPVVLYASIGLACRTSNSVDYFVAGRRVPGVYNGMAIGADWMSVASFMGLAGLLYVNGYGGLAYVLGWTGGFCLIAFFLAPYLRRYGQFTIPDFLGERYPGFLPRFVGLVVTALCSFMYVVAQVYGVGLITSRLTGFSFEIGIFVGLGGILVCSFLGGMRAVTWTQVAQYILLLLAFLLPVLWLSVKQTGNPVPQAILGEQLQKVSQREKELLADPREQQVSEFYRIEAARYGAMLNDVDGALARERAAAQALVRALTDQGAPTQASRIAERDLRALPKDAAEARTAWARAREGFEERARPLGGMPPQAQQFAGDPHGTPAQVAAFADSRLNFLALVFCLMAGTAGMPHLLTRFYTASSVGEARKSVTWAVLCIVLLYISAPVLAVLLKYEVLTNVVGLGFDELPRWILEWAKVDSGLLSVADVNGDGVLQFGELRISGDILVLAAPEIGGMPFVVTCLVAAGGLAAALSTADGLLLTTANAVSHDFYFRLVDRDASPGRRVVVTKVVLMVVAMLAAYIATHKPAAILLVVTPVFSVAAATIFPALVLGVFWKRANHVGASAGMLAGLAITLYYLITRHPSLRPAADAAGAPALWFGIHPASAAVFGVPVALAVTVLASLVTRADAGAAEFVAHIRTPQA